MQYRIGQIVEGTITGIQPYGAFVSLDEETSGLIHISEISEGFVKDVNHFVHVHDRVKVKIIDFDKSTHQAQGTRAGEGQSSASHENWIPVAGRKPGPLDRGSK